jgi:hypothetical protein
LGTRGYMNGYGGLVYTRRFKFMPKFLFSQEQEVNNSYMNSTPYVFPKAANK